MATINNTKVPAITASMSGSILTFTGDNGQSIHIDYTNLTPEMASQCLLHGLKAKIGDAGAIARNTDTGRSATTDDKMAAMTEVRDRLLAGEWNKIRTGGDGSSTTLLAAALCELTGKSASEIADFLAGQDADHKAALKKNERVAVIMARMSAERAAKKDGAIDTDALLNDLL